MMNARMLTVETAFRNTSNSITRPLLSRGTLAGQSLFCNTKRYVNPESIFTCSQNLLHYITFGKKDWDGDHLGFEPIY